MIVFYLPLDAQIQLIARNNNFPRHLIQKLNPQIQHKVSNRKIPSKKNHKIWTKFTYNSPKIRKIINLFKKIQAQHSKPHQHYINSFDPHQKSKYQDIKKWSIQNNIGTALEQWLRCCATNRKVASSIPAGVIGIFPWHKILPIALWSWGRLSL